ncbi:MAG: TetR/AcrR family transcriptional regulator [Enterobacteriaceae bacterium]
MKTDISDSILNAAEELFNKFGYDAISLDVVAEKANVAKRTLYKYFGCKNSLVCEVLRRRDKYFQTSLLGIISIFTTPQEKVNAIIAWHIKWFCSENYHGCMFIRAQIEYGDSDEAILSIVRQHKEWIEELIRSSAGISASHHEVSRMIMVMLEGMITYSMLFKCHPDSFLLEKKTINQLIEATVA